DEAVRLADLTGDGKPDFLRIEDDHLLVWAGVAVARWSREARRIDVPLPAGVPSLSGARVVLADLTGDGTADLVVVIPGRILAFANRGGVACSLHADLAVPGLESADDVVVTDLFGDGMNGLLIWDRETSSGARYVRVASDGDVPRLRTVR